MGQAHQDNRCEGELASGVLAIITSEAMSRSSILRQKSLRKG
jgi:hypothetical protein